MASTRPNSTGLKQRVALHIFFVISVTYFGEDFAERKKKTYRSHFFTMKTKFSQIPFLRNENSVFSSIQGLKTLRAIF